MKKLTLIVSLLILWPSIGISAEALVADLPEREGASVQLRHNFAQRRFRGWSETSRRILGSIVDTVQTVFRSQAFAEALASIGPGEGEFTFTHTKEGRRSKSSLKTIRTFEHNLDNAAELDAMTGTAVLGRITGDVSFTLRPYKTGWPWSSVRAFRSGSTISLNTWKFKSAKVETDFDEFASYCNTVAHELTHLLGFEHAAKSGWNPNSIPYVIGDIVEEIVKRSRRAS